MRNAIKTKIIQLPTFEQLTPDQQERVIQNYYDINIDHDWWSDEDYDNLAEILGIENFKLYFSGFHSQGDGACFEGDFGYNPKCAQKMKEYAPMDKELQRIAQNWQDLQKDNFYQIYGSVKHSGHYYHKYCTSFDIMNKKTGDNVNAETENATMKIMRDFMSWLYKNLNDQYDYLTSEEAIKETLICNEYTFNSETLKIEV